LLYRRARKWKGGISVANKICVRCGKENTSEGEVYCPECGSGIRGKNRKRLWYLGVAAVLLLLVGGGLLYGEKHGWEFSWDSLLRRPPAVINGEPIAWSEARERFRITRLMMEKKYGRELFAGERGGAYLRDLERDIVERMISERLVAQEAQRLNIKVGDDRVKQQMQEIGKEIYGNWENFQASLREDGISEDYLFAHVRNLILRQEVKKAKAPAGVDSDEYFGAWLAQDRRGAKITLNENVRLSQVSFQGAGSCCGAGGRAGGGTGGCGTKQSGPLDPALKTNAGAAALEAYRQTHPAEKGLETKVTDYGCHVQVDIEKEGKIVASYSYSNGKVSEI